MLTQTIADLPLNYLIEFEIFSETEFDVTLATDISFHSLISGKNFTNGISKSTFRIF